MILDPIRLSRSAPQGTQISVAASSSRGYLPLSGVTLQPVSGARAQGGWVGKTRGGEADRGSRVVCETLKPKASGYSFMSIAISVPFPTPEGPAITIGRITCKPHRLIRANVETRIKKNVGNNVGKS